MPLVKSRYARPVGVEQLHALTAHELNGSPLVEPRSASAPAGAVVIVAIVRPPLERE
jgi:hypothetical protein